MSELLAATLGAFAVIGIPFVAWFSRRATREGRLLLRVERLGSVLALMPLSPERDIFETHVNGAVADLNLWLDADNAKRRGFIRNVNRWTYSLGVLAALVVLPSIDATVNPWQSSLVGTIIGGTIAIVTIGTSFLLERSARSKAARAEEERDEAAAVLRMEALRRGEQLPECPPVKRHW